jgi:hypothetical protein
VTRRSLWLAAVILLAACQSPLAHAAPRAITPQTISVQPGDVPGMQRCATSGPVTTVLSHEKTNGSPSYSMNATEWEQWKQQGAVDAYLAVYGRTDADCAAASDSTTGAPQGGLIVGLVVQFADTNGAARNYQRDSALMGLGPRDILFIELAGGKTTFGSATGLGTDSAIGSAQVAGAAYFVARWHNRRFQSEFIGYDMAFADADQAVMDMNRRIPPA